MSTKRVLGIAGFGIAFIVCVICAMLLASYSGRDAGEFVLPDPSPSRHAGESADSDVMESLKRVVVTAETVQEVIKTTLRRPESYTRTVNVERFWNGGSTKARIETAVSDRVTALKILIGSEPEKRVVLTENETHIWYAGERTPYTGGADQSVDFNKISDEQQMLVTYEDVLALSISGILDAGYEEYGGESCIYVEYNSPLLGNRTKYWVSVSLGLVTCAEEYDGDELIYKMTAGECVVGEPDVSFFTLPDGRSVL